MHVVFARHKNKMTEKINYGEYILHMQTVKTKNKTKTQATIRSKNGPILSIHDGNNICRLHQNHKKNICHIVDTCIQYNILVYSGKSASTVACKSGKHLVNKSQFTANSYCLNIGDPAKLFPLTIIA